VLLVGLSWTQVLVVLSIFPGTWVLQLSQLVRWGRHDLLNVMLLYVPLRLLESLLFMLGWLVGDQVLLGLRGMPVPLRCVLLWLGGLHSGPLHKARPSLEHWLVNWPAVLHLVEAGRGRRRRIVDAG
jgi:hypothetical protein